MPSLDQNDFLGSSDLDRRNFLKIGAAGPLALGFAGHLSGRPAAGRQAIFLLLVGGPSQLDTWDPKPEAPREVRGPFRPIPTNVPGVRISEIFPRMARQADKYAILRTLHHQGAAVHDAGHQLMQTGRFFRDGTPEPHFGCVAGMLRRDSCGCPPIILPGPIGNTGGRLPHGQDAGYLGRDFDPLILKSLSGEPKGDPRWNAPAIRQALDLRRESDVVRERYGRNRFGASCLLARRLTEAGAPFVTVNMFETVFDQITWDIHGASPFSPIDCYADRVGPTFDRAYSALLEDLSASGRLESTLVVAAGEFGRTPRINPLGGRDHWPQCWSMLMAGGGVRGGQTIGESDGLAAEPKERPITPAEVAATIYHALGIDPALELPRPDGTSLPLVDRGAKPISELFA